jgi:peptidoglycan/LPS O-acetylase OafA/YrhL
MKGKTMNITTGVIVPLLLGAISALIVYVTLTGRTLPLIAGPRAGLVALLIVGMAMCTAGIGQVGVSGRWASPLAILGYLLGIAILLVFVAGLSGWKLPWIAGQTQAVAAVAILMGVKYLIGTAGFFFHLL